MKTDRDTRTLRVELGERSYPIYIGPGLIDQASIYRQHIPGQQVMVVTNETIAPLYLDRVLTALKGYQTESVILPDGEHHKTLSIWNQIFDALLNSQFNRQCSLVALGGGVIGDMAGFAAACYQRGVHLIQIPTTLLSQVDSSVGGKTGVNHLAGKNMIGAFYQPRCVIADTQTLNTLDDRQLAAGMAEIIKYGLIDDVAFFEWLESAMDRLLARDPVSLSEAIERSCRDKAILVAADEREAGSRALLNLGHTFGHAIETGLGYGAWLHGEAVAVGICMAADLSRRLGWLSGTEMDRTLKLIQQAGLPLNPPEELERERFLSLMSVDKKVLSGRLRLVLLKGIGRSLVTEDFDSAALISTLDEYGRNSL
ncbi:MAG: 3-dehydroquinate synthase [Gammaproteobacteria bacterium]|nr:3-dehydroquinate synthase [Gammaproteobacteria bacterium]